MKKISILQLPTGLVCRTQSAATALVWVVLASHVAAAVTITEYPAPVAPGTAGAPISITAGPDGNLWFTRGYGQGSSLRRVAHIGKMSTGGCLTEYRLQRKGSILGSITAGPDGNVWFTDYGNGAHTGYITPSGHTTEYPNPSNGDLPNGITAGPDGNLWYAAFGLPTRHIGRITPSGVFTEFPVPVLSDFLHVPNDITAGPDGNLWFTESEGYQISKITTSGVVTRYDLPTAASEIAAITAGPDGNLWFTEYYGGKIGRITTSGVITEFTIPTVNGRPTSITTGPDGNLWFTEMVGSKIGSITTSGVFTEYAVPTSGSRPQDITLGPDGNLWFTESNANQIGKVDLTGVNTTSGADVCASVSTTFLNTKTNLDTTVVADVTFASVTTAGNTSVAATSTPADVPPPTFTIDVGRCSATKTLACEIDADCPSGETCTGFHGFAFDVTTTANVTPPIVVCAHYPDNEAKPEGGNGSVDGTGKPGLPEQSLRLLHEENGVFTDVTLPGYPDTLNNVVCGQVNSLSAAAAARAGRAPGTVQGSFGVYVKTDMPGNGSRLDTDCIGEWSLGDPKAGNPTLPKKKKSSWFFPDAQLTCKAGSATCAAPMAGFCTFRFRVCVNGNDTRLPCTPSDVKEFQLFEPKLADPPTDNDSINAQRILEKLGSLAASSTFATQVSFNSPVASPLCTDNIEVVLPANGVTRLVRLTASDSGGRADSNSLKLLCK